MAVYNGAPYIRQALDSLLRVIPDDGRVELLLVDDGSTDTTASILAEYGSRLHVITIQNAGLSVARNVALEQARGEYIGYLDADDYWGDDVSWPQIEALLQRGADIVEFNIDVVDDQGRVSEHFDVCCATPGEVVPLTRQLLDLACAKRLWYVWARFYRRAVWGGHRFPAGMIYEDMLTLPFVYSDAKTLLCADFVLVRYRVVPDSLSRGISPKRVNSLLWGLGHFYRASSTADDFYAHCVRSCYEMLLRTAALLPDEALGADFFPALDRQRRLIRPLVFRARARFLFCFFFPVFCFDYFRWKHLRGEAQVSATAMPALSQPAAPLPLARPGRVFLALLPVLKVFAPAATTSVASGTRRPPAGG